MREETTLAILVRFAEPARRAEASVDLAKVLGASSLTMLVRDPEIGALVPAMGFPRTIRGGPKWRAFVAKCATPGTHSDVVEHPTPDVMTRATALVDAASTAVVLFGEVEPRGPAFEALVLAMPLVGAMLRAETAAYLAAGDAVAARAASKHAHELALALDAARADVQRALAESARLNDELREADRRKDEFLAMLGHELRNPMAGISSALALARLAKGDPKRTERAREIMERQADQMSRLIDDLLDVSRIQTGKITIRSEPLDVGDIAGRAVDATQGLVQSRLHSLSVNVDPKPIWIMGDSTRVEQIISNLLTNAAKYTPQGGAISLTVAREANAAVVRVKDSGVGVSAEMLPKIFDAFVQVPQSFDRAAGGMGIGLTLVRRLVDLHGGSIDVTSEVGVGSEFVVRLPALAADYAPEAPSLDDVAVATARKRVLIVDDNADSAEMVFELVAEWGHEPRCAHDGLEALAAAEEFRPDVVLLDLGLPGIDGYEVARRMREMDRVRDARIIAMSGYGLEGDRARSRSAGFDAHLVKPVDLVMLERALASSLATSPPPR